MKTTGARIVGVFTACLLGVGLSAPPSVQAEAGAAVQRADRPKVTAKIRASYMAGAEATADGRFLVGVKDDRLVRYRIRPKKIREVGRSLEDTFAVSPAGKTKGLIYSTQVTNGERYLVSIKN